VADTQPDGKNRYLDPGSGYLEGRKRATRVRGLHRVVVSALRLTWEAGRRGFVIAALLQILGALSVTALVVVGHLALDAILAANNQSSATRSLLPVIVLLAVVTAVGSAASTLQQQQQRLLGEEVSIAVWRRMLDVTGRVNLEFYESPTFYDQLQRVQSNALVRPITVTTAIFGLIGGAFGLGGLLAALLAVEPLLVPALLLAGIPSLLLSRRASRLEFRFVTLVNPTFRARQYLRAVLTGRDEAKEVRAFGAEGALRSRHDDRSEEYLVRLRGHVRTRQRYALGSVATTSIALTMALALLAWFLFIGRISFAEAGAAALAVRLLSSRLEQLFRSIASLMESAVFLEDLDRFLMLTVVADGPGTGAKPPLARALSVEELSYTYPGSAEPVLHDVNMWIGAGEVVAIVGENGSGKTTLAKLIAGLYSPTQGTIRWDDVSASEMEPADLRRGVAVIFQDFVRYKLSAQENIGLGEPAQVDDEDAVRSAASRAGAATFLERLPKGYETTLSKEFADGQDLSLGQWQRVALARALRKDAPLVILDEPSSALDPRAEQALFADVRRTLHGRTAILISHRYSTVRTADRIYVMRDGRIAETGTHDELMADDGLYAELFSLQARAYR
jgi:ATP-binding cassette subfamily B protein